MAHKVLILHWKDSAYDSLRGLLLLVGAELNGLGIEVEEILLDTPDCNEKLAQRLTSGDIMLALGMSGLGVDLRDAAGVSLWEKTQVPFYNWNCDHPCYFPARHVIRNRFIINGYVFPDHAMYATQYLNSTGLAFSAHLGLPDRALFPLRPANGASRNGRIMFTKSGRDPNALEAEWREKFHPTITRIMFSAAETLLTHSTGDFLPVLQQHAQMHGIHLAGNGALALLMIQSLDAYIRFRRADKVARVAARYPVDVFGNGWDHIDWTTGAARYHGSRPWLDMVEQLPAYLGCLSTNPLVDYSVHDRVFFALSARVAPISDANAFSQVNMPELAPFSFGIDDDSIAASIEYVLDNPEDALERTENTWATLYPHYSLKHSAHQIVQSVKLAWLNTHITSPVRPLDTYLN